MVDVDLVVVGDDDADGKADKANRELAVAAIRDVPVGKHGRPRPEISGIDINDLLITSGARARRRPRARP